LLKNLLILLAQVVASQVFFGNTNGHVP